VIRIECEICGRNNAELHHIVFKSAAPWMKNIPINFKYLCECHHRGNDSPHKNRKIDLQYKQELQLKLELLFTNESYTVHEIKELLDISTNEVNKLMHKVPCKNEQFEKKEIIKRMMGGRFYL
jgi:predicted XRE-type DNA-binding protein